MITIGLILIYAAWAWHLICVPLDKAPNWVDFVTGVMVTIGAALIAIATAIRCFAWVSA